MHHLKDRILANIAEAKSKGYKIVSGNYGYSNTCCPLNAACIVQGARVTTDERRLAEANDIELDQAASFIRGFDNDSLTTQDIRKYYDLGAELRAMLDRREI